MSVGVFDGTVWPRLHVEIGTGGAGTDPGPGYLHLDVGPGLGTGMLGGPTFVNVTADALRISNGPYGPASEIDQATPGRFQITFDDTSGDYNPANPDTPWWGPNLLTLNQQSLETDTTGWQAGADTTIARSTAQAYHGVASLQLTKVTGAGTLYAQAGTGITGVLFPALTPIRGRVRFKADSTLRSARIRLAFHTTAGTYLSGQDLISASVAEAIGEWVQALVTGLSPDEPTRVVPELQVLSGAVSEVHYADDVWVEAGGLEIGMPIRVRAEYPIGTLYDRAYGTIVDVAPDLGYSPRVVVTCVDALETLGRAQLAALSPASAAYDGDTTGERIGRLADAALWPTSLRSIDTGYSLLGPTVLGGSALELARKTALTEFGVLYADGAGRLVFHDRHRATTATRSTTVQVAFADTQGAGEVEYLTLNPARSAERVHNDVHATRDPDPFGADDPAEQVTTDQTSVARYGLLSLTEQVAPLARNDFEVLATTQYLAARFGYPRTRVREVTVEAITLGLWSVLLGLRLLDRISVARDYGVQWGPVELLIQAMSEEIVNDESETSWTFTFSTMPPPPTPDLWVLGTSAIGAGRLGW